MRFVRQFLEHARANDFQEVCPLLCTGGPQIYAFANDIISRIDLTLSLLALALCSLWTVRSIPASTRTLLHRRTVLRLTAGSQLPACLETQSDINCLANSLQRGPEVYFRTEYALLHIVVLLGNVAATTIGKRSLERHSTSQATELGEN